MANTYSQLFYHLVFAVRNRKALITAVIKDDLYKYISGIISKQNQKLFIINGMPDHVHLLLNTSPDIHLSALIREIKEHSSKFINQKGIFKEKFYWQAGFGVFTVSKSGVANVLNYIKNQEEHHAKVAFRNEYLKMLEEYEVEFKHEYLFEFFDEVYENPSVCP